MKKFLKRLLVLAILAGIGYGGWWYYSQRAQKPQPVYYRTEDVKKGPIVQEVTATGTIEPIKEVDVGTQVNGPILHLYADFNSIVTNDQIIAVIDPAAYDAVYAKVCAQLKSNEANVEEIGVKLDLAQKTLKRQRELAKRGMAAQSALDDAEASVGTLAAELKVAQATVEQSKASVKEAKTDLDYCTIRSPVNGIVIDRTVDEGQTVVSSMSAQQLFNIALDLRRIQVKASVPEADVGEVRSNQLVRFTVDAYRKTFTGRVVQIRLASTTESNVVTYPVIIEADNPDEMLFPGMTANINIEIGRNDNAVIIPASALRYTPSGLETDIKGPKVWVDQPGGEPRAVAVKLGITDSTHYAVESAEDLTGKKLVVGVESAASALASGDGAAKNPFMPKMPDRHKKSNSGTPPPPGGA